MDAVQDAPTDIHRDVDITKSQDAVITEISEQYVGEASTAEVSNRRAAALESVKNASDEPDNVQIAVGGIGDVPAAMHGHGDLPFERFSSLGQRDGYGSREASNGTGLYGFDEKVEAGRPICRNHLSKGRGCGSVRMWREKRQFRHALSGCGIGRSWT